MIDLVPLRARDHGEPCAALDLKVLNDRDQEAGQRAAAVISMRPSAAK